MGMRQACPGEMVTYTCTVNQRVVLDWIVEPFISGSDLIRFPTISTSGEIVNCNDVVAVQCEHFNFVATLTNHMIAMVDITSMLTFTATARLDGTVVQCRGLTADAVPIQSNLP